MKSQSLCEACVIEQEKVQLSLDENIINADSKIKDVFFLLNSYFYIKMEIVQH